MALPKPSRPEYTATIPSTGKRVKYQPFTVKEEKVLILAAESQDLDEVSNAIANVLGKCVTSPADFDVNKLALFDIEFLFLRARAKSIGETIKLNITDPNDETYTVQHELNVDDIKVEKNKDHKDLIEVSEDCKIKMRYPGLEFFAEGLKVDNIQESTETVAKCVGQLVIGDEVYNREDLTAAEIEEWLDDLTTAQYGKIMEFFVTMPKLRHVIKLKNKKTGEDFSTVLEGLADFF
ncbi:baseplate hub subunit [Synechococcus phage S-N03]|uniref:Baseplate hub subunit n=1 Tax=Synechococcus phage S-N03 TaxID=2718943 RepID=A0A6G8R5X1_9CAUD|nr:baseplate hub [Synechococcus phage S-N03]QIN96790.1 baseplate hub subunit [Synechococcus phage S-N03]